MQAAAVPAILMIDDQPARLLTYESVLEGVGVRCVRALSGEEALAKLLRETFAVILLDVSMPGMDGFETARLIREHPRFEKTPIIFITGVHVSELDRLKGYEAGAIDYIAVPIVPEILRSKVALLVELYRRRADLEALNRDLELSRADRAEKEWLSALLNSMSEEVYFTDTEQRYSYVNPAALREFGDNVVVGRTVAELVAGLDVYRLDGSRRPLEEAPPLRSLKGEIVRQEEQLVRNPRTGELRQRQVSSAPVRDAQGQIIGAVSVVRDVTELRRVDEDLRRRDARSRALLRLSDRFRALKDPADVAYAASQVLGETLGVERCGYGVIDIAAETIHIDRDWNAPGSLSIAGTLKFREYGRYIDDLKRGDTVVIADTLLDERTAQNAPSLAELKVRAFVNMPIMEHGVAEALLFLSHSRPRLWAADELEFIREVAERTRATAERRRVEQTVEADLRITRLLRDLAARTVIEDNVQDLYEEVLSLAVTIARADAGTLQLLDESGNELYFVAIRGLPEVLTAHFARVSAASGSPCGVALATGRRTFMDFDGSDTHDPDGSSRLHYQYGLRSAASTPLISRSGKPLGMYSTHWHKHSRLDERQIRFLDLLARQVADLIERTNAERALRANQQFLRDADRRKDEFIAMLAHELRNPLVPIRTGVELLKRAGEQPEVVESVRPIMERQIGHMVRLIEDLLDVSRITAGKIELRRESVSLSILIGNAVDANRDAIAAAALNLKLEIEDPDLQVLVDPTRFSQILSNVLQNAAKFTPNGGRIVLKAGVELAPQGARDLVIRIADSGVGISQELLPNIFELFAQASSAGMSRHSGLGIGLALARRLAELHGGTLTANSDGVDRGSEFVLRIPAPAPLADAAAGAASSATLEGLSVLVVDDNRDGADLMALLIEDAGAKVKVAYDGPSAIEAVLGNKPDLVVLDIGMPGMDGYEVCRRLRQEHGSSLGIVALTGWGQDQDKRQALQAGFDAHLTKPADPSTLAEILRGVSERLRAH
jgi:PAS domain S-box-containing protein